MDAYEQTGARSTSTESPSIRVIIADDHSLVRDGTRKILEAQPDIAVVGEAQDGVEAVETTVRLRPDVALLDVRMPGLSGVEATRQIKERVPDTAVILVSAYDDDDYVFSALEAGASGYFLKTARASELVDAVRRARAGDTPLLHPAVAQKIARMWLHRGQARQSDLALTAREMEVLGLVCQGLRNKEIAHRLEVSVRTVEGHLDAIFTKLGVRSRTEAAMLAASRGWFSGDDGTN